MVWRNNIFNSFSHVLLSRHIFPIANIIHQKYLKHLSTSRCRSPSQSTNRTVIVVFLSLSPAVPHFVASDTLFAGRLHFLHQRTYIRHLRHQREHYLSFSARTRHTCGYKKEFLARYSVVEWRRRRSRRGGRRDIRVGFFLESDFVCGTATKKVSGGY